MTQLDTIEEKLDRLLSLLTAQPRNEPNGVEVFNARKLARKLILEKQSGGKPR